MFRKILLILIFTGIANAQLLTQIDNQIFHLAGNVGVTVTGAGISSWADQSGNALDFQQGVDADRPEYVSSTYASFDGSNSEFVGGTDTDLLTFGNGTTDEPFSIVVYTNVGSGVTGLWLEKLSGSATAEYRIFYQGSGDKITLDICDANTSNQKRFQPTVTSDIGTGFHTVAITYAGDGSTVIFYLDGTALTTASPTVSGIYVAMENTAAGPQIGKTSLAGGVYGTFLLQDMIVTNDILTPIEIGNIQTYFETGDWPTTAPTSLNPANLATDVSTSPTFTWSDGGTGEAAADSYFVKVSENADLSSTVIDDKTITESYVGSGLSNMTTYYWNVAAKNAVDTTYSDTLSFTTVSAAMTTKRDFGGYTKFKGFKK